MTDKERKPQQGGLTNSEFKQELAKVRPGSANYERQWAELMKARQVGKNNGL